MMDDLETVPSPILESGYEMIWPFRRFWRPRPAARPAVDAAQIVRRARRLRFRVKPEAVSQLAGAYHGARPGIGLTFAELRAYEPGDDVRHIDWNVTARQGKPFVRRFVEERSLTLWLVIDVSASMRFGLEGRTKADRAAQAAALLATAAVHNGDRVGLLMVSDRLEVELAPSGGIRHLSQIVRALVATPTSSIKTQLGVGLSRVRRSVRRSLIVVLSDFDSDEPVGIWRRAARRHDTIALRIVDPLEERLPDAGLLSLEDAEHGKSRVVDSSSRRLRADYERTAQERLKAFRHWCATSGVDGHTMSTDVEPLHPLVELFARERRGEVRIEPGARPGPHHRPAASQPRARALVSGHDRAFPSRRGRPGRGRRPAHGGVGHPPSPSPATATGRRAGATRLPR